jgi:large subunit ribosomal protein L15
LVKQHELAPAAGSRHASKRVGRGTGSGHGTFSGRGCKGQKARTGNNKVRPGFEGGQLPLIKRLPRKRGFINHFRIEYTTVNTSDLNKLDSGSEVTAEILKTAGIIKTLTNPIKVLGDGEIDRPLTVKANKFSASAKAKIEKAGGKVEEV